jgi:hypothetical protein
MNALMRSVAVVVAAFGLLTHAALAADGKVAAALADGKAGGTLTVNGKVTKVAFAYARSVPGFFDPTKNDVEVILSDVALDAKALADSFARSDLAKDGKLHAFEMTINAAGVPVSTSWRHNGFNGPSPGGLSSDDMFTKKAFDAKIVDGGYKSAGQAEFFGNTYSFDVTFRAAIGH